MDSLSLHPSRLIVDLFVCSQRSGKSPDAVLQVEQEPLGHPRPTLSHGVTDFTFPKAHLIVVGWTERGKFGTKIRGTAYRSPQLFCILSPEVHIQPNHNMAAPTTNNHPATPIENSSFMRTPRHSAIPKIQEICIVSLYFWSSCISGLAHPQSHLRKIGTVPYFLTSQVSANLSEFSSHFVCIVHAKDFQEKRLSPCRLVMGFLLRESRMAYWNRKFPLL